MGKRNPDYGMTDKQKALIDVLVDPMHPLPIAQICEKAGISTNTYYVWKTKHPEVFQAAEDKINAYTDAALSSMWGALIERAVNGDTQALKLYFELKNKYKLEVDTKSEIRVVIDKDVADYGD